LAPPAAALGGTVTVQGYNFGASQNSSTVQFNSVTAAVRSWSNTSVAVTVPSNRNKRCGYAHRERRDKQCGSIHGLWGAYHHGHFPG